MTTKKYTHLTQNGILQGNMSPLDNVVPQFIGQQYLENQDKLYIANGLTPQSWHLIHSGVQLLLSVETYNDLMNTPLTHLKDGARCFVEETHLYYKLIDGVWRVESTYSYQIEEPVDKSVIWFTPLGKVVEKDTTSNITLEELMASISVLVAKIKGLEQRVTYLEEHGVVNPNNPSSEGLLLEDGNPLLLEDGNNIKLESV